MATLADFRARVRTLTGIESTGVISDAEVDVFINESMLTILATADWPFLVEQQTVTATAGSDTVTFPALSSIAYRVVDVFGKETTREKTTLLVERSAPFVSEDSDGHPLEFAWDPDTDTMTLYPAPSSDFEVTARFVVEPTTLVLDTDTSPIPDRFSNSVSFLAAARILEREADDSDRPIQFERRAYESVDHMKRVLLSSARKTVTLGGRRNYRRSSRHGAW